MKIDFNSMEPAVIPHFKDGEGETYARLHTDELGKIMRGTLPPGASIGLHVHDTSSEIVYILSGTGKVLYDGGYETVGPGDCHYCPKGHAHSLINDSDVPLEFFAVIPNQ